jgi:hypothetical protein
VAVTFEWNTEDRLLRTVVSGRLTEQEMLDYIREAWKRPDRADFDEVADYRQLDVSMISVSTLLKATQLSTELNRERKVYRVAFVVTGKLGFGVGRQYETLREATPTITRMFESIETAEQWIRESRARHARVANGRGS